MTVEEARNILEAKGFAVTLKPFRSYENAIADAVAKRNGKPAGVEPDGKGVRELDARKGGEELTSSSIAPSAGQGTLLQLTFSTILAGRTAAELRGQVLKRYGTPSRAFSPTYSGWCVEGDVCRPHSNRQPMLVYDDGSPVVTVLSLDGGTALRERLDAAMAAAVSQRAGRTSTSF